MILMTEPSLALHLAGRGELRRLLGVSHTRAVYLSDQPDFPAPLDNLSVGKIWALADITDWADRRGRAIDTDTPADTYPTTRLRLVGRGELRDLLGVSYTRAVQLAAQPDFPAPLDNLSIGKIWALADITDWANRKGRAIDLQALPPTAGPDIVGIADTDADTDVNP